MQVFFRAFFLTVFVHKYTKYLSTFTHAYSQIVQNCLIQKMKLEIKVLRARQIIMAEQGTSLLIHPTIFYLGKCGVVLIQLWCLHHWIYYAAAKSASWCNIHFWFLARWYCQHIIACCSCCLKMSFCSAIVQKDSLSPL